jgi:flavin reductase (DIM6/NTAB) family NADH-FMN oxidoreductase RutF
MRDGAAARLPEGSTGTDPGALRRALGRFATGVTVVTARAPSGQVLGLTANSLAAVSLDPPLLLWSIGARAGSLPVFLETGWFAVNVLSAAQHALARRFASPAPDRFMGIRWNGGLGGCPVLPGSLASFEWSLERAVQAGDHVVLIGRIHRAAGAEGDPLVFDAGRYGTAAPLP